MAHRSNEFIAKEQYLKGIKLFAKIYEDYASIDPHKHQSPEL